MSAACVVSLAGCAHRVHDSETSPLASPPLLTLAVRSHGPAVVTAIPDNMDVQSELAEPLRTSLSCSLVLRRQVRRVAQHPSLHVAIRAAVATHLGGSRARTRITGSGPATHALIELPATEWDGLELLSHELEHVIEFLDGVRLAAAPPGGVRWDTQGGAETIRAHRVGRIAAEECRQASRQVAAR